MEWVSFTTGLLVAAIAYSLFTQSPEEEIDEDSESLTVHTSSGRLVEMSCQTCRKLKRHRELEDYLFECTKCKRRIDLRRVS